MVVKKVYELCIKCKNPSEYGYALCKSCYKTQGSCSNCGAPSAFDLCARCFKNLNSIAEDVW